MKPSGKPKGNIPRGEAPQASPRIRVHVQDLKKSIDFYTNLFGSEPVCVEGDRASWRLDEPCTEFSITTLPCPPEPDLMNTWSQWFDRRFDWP